jgi:fatty-acyl-CoA synthase
VALHFVVPMPLTAVGKIFKPALRIDAMRRVAEQLLEGLDAGGQSVAVQVVPDAKHGQLVRVSLGGAQGAARERLIAAVRERLGPLTVRHEVV